MMGGDHISDQKIKQPFINFLYYKICTTKLCIESKYIPIANTLHPELFTIKLYNL